MMPLCQKNLATILRTIEKEVDIKDCAFVPYENTEVFAKLEEYGLRSVLNKIASISNVNITKEYNPENTITVDTKDDN